MLRSHTDRRAFCAALAACLANVSGCGRAALDETPRQGLTRVLGLEGEEIAWLDVLSEERQRRLLDGLASGGPSSSETVDLLMQLLGRRERLFVYVGYPSMPNNLEGCSGLIRE